MATMWLTLPLPPLSTRKRIQLQIIPTHSSPICAIYLPIIPVC